MQRTFQQTIHVSGTLGANVVHTCTVPFPMQLVEVSACASNDSDATIIIGTSSDTDAYLESAVIGDSGTPVVFTRTNFVGSQYPHIPDNTVVVVTVDYDGASGTAANDLSVVLTFTEG